MIWIGRIHLAQKLDAVHEPGHTRGDVVIAVEPNRAVCDCFGGLCVRAGDGDVVGSETFLELSKRWQFGCLLGRERILVRTGKAKARPRSLRRGRLI